MLRLLAAAIGLLLVSVAVKADVYVWRDARGVLNYSDTPPPEGARDVKILKAPRIGRDQAPGAVTGERGPAPRVGRSAPAAGSGGAPARGVTAWGSGASPGAGGGDAGLGTAADGGMSAAGSGASTSGGTTTGSSGTSTAGSTTPPSGGGTSTAGGSTTPSGGGTSTAGGTTPAPGDTTPPSTPTGLTASEITPTSFTLSWDAATDNVGVVSSRIYRNGTLIVPAATSRNVPISGLSPDTSYAITIAAVDGAGNASAQSAPLTVTTPATVSAATPCGIPAGGYEGFGRNTTGGAGKPVYRVTNLNDSGPGSLREAISQGNRCVVFGVGGTIALASMLSVRGANITIDGFTAPSPGVTLRNYDLEINGNRGANNVIVRGIRSRDAFRSSFGNPADGIAILATSNVVIDHVSVSGFGDGGIDITDHSHDVTVQWSIFAEGNPTVSHNFLNLIKYGTTRISIHHNLYFNGASRNPHCGGGDAATANPPEVVCDVRNNLIWNYPNWGTEVRSFGTANVVNNYYFSSNNSPDALYVDQGARVYASGNFSQNGLNVNSRGNRSTPFAAIVPTTTDAITAAHQIVAQAGARGPSFGLDPVDQGYVLKIAPVRP